MAMKVENTKTLEDTRYHNTWKLLKVYRDVVWSMEVSVSQLRNEFRDEYGSSIEEFLDSAYLAGADLNGTEIEQYVRSIERSNKMLTLLRNAIEVMRTKHKNGEVLYWVLYYTFLSPQELSGIVEIIDQLRPHTKDISVPTYYRKRAKAVEVLSSILWGYSAQENLKILEQFIPAEGDL